MRDVSEQAASGCLHLYCGDGKGKTTAAVGAAVRALGCGWRVLFVQFLKSRMSGELAVLEKLPGVMVLRSSACEKFTFQMNAQELEACCASNRETLEQAAELMQAGHVCMVVLDELAGALSTGVMEEHAVRHLLERRPAGCELVITGRNPPAWLSAQAHYITRMEKEKHPFDQGLAARRGIEW